MSKILILAPSGFGKTTMIGPVEKLGIEGLDPKDSYIISVTSKPLPFDNSKKLFPVTTKDKLSEGRRVIAKTPKEVDEILKLLLVSPVKNVVLDDFNYLMQDWYMENALKSGWDGPKTIGHFMGKIFKTIESFDDFNKNIIVMAHGEDIVRPDGRIYTKLKTTGKMVDEYVTPEGKFDITLIGKSRWDGTEKKVVKELITNEDEFYSSPKSAPGLFPLYIQNDLGKIIKSVNIYYNGE